MTNTSLARIGRGVVVSGAVALLGLCLGHVAPMPKSGFLPASFVTHSAMLVLSLVIIWVTPRASFADFGFTTRRYRFKPAILLWVFPTAVVSWLAIVTSRGPKPPGPVAGLSHLQLVLFVWIYASVCEEVLTRGLLQTLVANEVPQAPQHGRLSMPVLISALFFGAMHLVLVPSMGLAAAVPIVLAILLGFVAAHYRESTGSLVPAILVHALFNVGGMLPQWLAEWATA